MNGQNTRWMKPVLVSLLAMTLGFAQTLMLSAQAGKLDITKNTPIEMSAYPEAKSFDTPFTAASQIMSVLDTSRNIPVHMEAIRRGYQQLSPAEQKNLLTALETRHDKIPDDPVKYFDHGYAEFMYRGNKTGLFWLRKANDQLKNQFASLAYAMAQADADLDIENVPAETMSTRKMDVTYKVADAIRRDSDVHMKGFWPTFVRIVTKLREIPVYYDALDSDYSEYYVPVGTKPSLQFVVDNRGIADLVEKAVNNSASCDIAESASVSNELDGSRVKGRQLFRTFNADLTNNGKQDAITIFTTDDPARYKVMVVSADTQRVIADVLSPVVPYVFEDIDGDNVQELVFRQYRSDPLHPIQVFRFNQCHYVPDNDIQKSFE